MSRTPNQKIKLLYLKDILKKADEKNPVTMPMILEKLAAYGIDAERKSIYRDMQILEQYGMEIQLKKGFSHDTSSDFPSGYYTTDRLFELPELKLLVDAVQYSRFISEKKSRELIGKLISLAKTSEEHSLNRQVITTGRNKSHNEHVYYNVDTIHEAIAGNLQIRFQYFQWNLKKEHELRHGGAWYQVSPWALVWDDENYYLIAYDTKAGICKNYRVDKMLRIDLMPDIRQGKEVFEAMNISAYSERTFSMFAGQETNVSLLCENSMIGVILDRFGPETFVTPSGQDHFTVNVRVAVSSPFYGWVFGLGGKVRITGPESVKKEMADMASRFLLPEDPV